MDRRQEKLVSLLRDEVSSFLGAHAEVPPGILLTVTEVKISSDRQHADIAISIFPTGRIGVFLEKFKRWQHEFNTHAREKLLLKNIPAVRFRLDEAALKEERLEKLLEEDKK